MLFRNLIPAGADIDSDLYRCPVPGGPRPVQVWFFLRLSSQKLLLSLPAVPDLLFRGPQNHLSPHGIQGQKRSVRNLSRCLPHTCHGRNPKTPGKNGGMRVGSAASGQNPLHMNTIHRCRIAGQQLIRHQNHILLQPEERSLLPALQDAQQTFPHIVQVRSPGGDQRFLHTADHTCILRKHLLHRSVRLQTLLPDGKLRLSQQLPILQKHPLRPKNLCLLSTCRFRLPAKPGQLLPGLFYPTVKRFQLLLFSPRLKTAPRHLRLPRLIEIRLGHRNPSGNGFSRQHHPFRTPAFFLHTQLLPSVSIPLRKLYTLQHEKSSFVLSTHLQTRV